MKAEPEAPTHERRTLFHLLRYPDHVSLIEDKLRPERFTDETCRWGYQLLLYWRHHVGYSLTLDSALEQVGKRVTDAAAKERLTALFIGLLDFEGSTKADLEHSVSELDRAWRSRQVLDLTTRLAEKLARNAEAPINEELQALFDTTNPDDQGSYRNTKGAGDAYARMYEEVRASATPLGFTTGFGRIDALTGGMRRNQLWIWSAFTSHGKTACAREVAYHFGAKGRRVLYVSLEMAEEDILLGFYARRSHDIAKSVGRGLRPLRTEDLRDGKLDKTQEKLYALARRDVDGFDIGVWVPGDASISDVRRRVSVEQLQRSLDLVVVDYLALCRPERKRGTDREEVGDLVRECKRMARRESVPVLALHQISRDGFEKACQRGYYMLTDQASSSEVERNADVVVWNLLTEDMRASNELRVGVAKNRHGDLMSDGYHVYTDFATSIVAERLEGAQQADFFKQFMG